MLTENCMYGPYIMMQPALHFEVCLCWLPFLEQNSADFN